MPSYQGTIFMDIEAIVNQVFDKYMCRGCGNKQEECDCPPADPREALYDDPARCAR